MCIRAIQLWWSSVWVSISFCLILLRAHRTLSGMQKAYACHGDQLEMESNAVERKTRQTLTLHCQCNYKVSLSPPVLLFACVCVCLVCQWQILPTSIWRSLCKICTCNNIIYSWSTICTCLKLVVKSVNARFTSCTAGSGGSITGTGGIWASFFLHICNNAQCKMHTPSYVCVCVPDWSTSTRRRRRGNVQICKCTWWPRMYCLNNYIMSYE